MGVNLDIVAYTQVLKSNLIFKLRMLTCLVGALTPLSAGIRGLIKHFNLCLCV